MLLTWQPRDALRKLSTDVEMGAAAVTMTRTRPPRDSCSEDRACSTFTDFLFSIRISV